MLERSYGIIPIRRGKVLLVRLHAGHWSFPKGHAEEGEAAKETAERELFEETGMRVKRWLSEETFSESYFYTREGIVTKKRVDYFLAEVEGEVEVQAHEIAELRLVKPEDVEELLTFNESKKVWKEAREIL